LAAFSAKDRFSAAIIVSENRNDRPRQFDLVAAVNLRRFTAVVVSPPAEFHSRVQQEAGHEKKNDAADGEYEQRQLVNQIGGCRGRSKIFGVA
jgi:hypothetical protein